ncbi:MAG: MBL fold metallo-hydrolase [Pseudomonadota bacterium]
MKKALILLVVVLAILGIAQCSLRLPAVQDALLSRGVGAMAQSASAEFKVSQGLQVYVCGSASPLGAGQAQACIAVVTPEHFYLIDTGAGSSANIASLGLPMQRLQGLLLTHFHSDHIAEIYEVNLASWVGGRPEPLTVYGPEGVDEVIEAVNFGYRRDRHYRTTHHGEDLLPAALGVLAHQTVAANTVIENGQLKITAYAAEHPPIHPAVGYRFDYRGRSVVISGDSNVTETTERISDGADLLLHDALSLETVNTLSAALADAGLTRRSTIVNDVIDYHASTQSLIDLATRSNVDMIAFYHLVPVPPNSIAESVFMRGTPEHFVLTKDLMWFELPAGGDDIIVHRP